MISPAIQWELDSLRSWFTIKMNVMTHYIICVLLVIFLPENCESGFWAISGLLIQLGFTIFQFLPSSSEDDYEEGSGYEEEGSGYEHFERNLGSVKKVTNSYNQDVSGDKIEISGNPIKLVFGGNVCKD